MTTEKTFTRVGISKCEKGRVRFRFTNDPKRENVLIKAGHEDITFFELDAPLTKEAATAFLLSKGLQENDPVAAARAAREAAPKAPKAPKATSRKADEALLAALAAGELGYDEESDSFKSLIAQKRQTFPSHTDEQLAEIVRHQVKCNLKTFGDIEPNF